MISSHLYHLSMAAGICIGWRLGQWLVQQLDLLGAFGVNRQSLGRLGAQFREFGQGGGGVGGEGGNRCEESAWELVWFGG